MSLLNFDFVFFFGYLGYYSLTNLCHTTYPSSYPIVDFRTKTQNGGPKFKTETVHWQYIETGHWNLGEVRDEKSRHVSPAILIDCISRQYTEFTQVCPDVKVLEVSRFVDFQNTLNLSLFCSHLTVSRWNKVNDTDINRLY